VSARFVQPIALGQLAALVQGRLVGADPSIEVHALCSLDQADPQGIGFCHGARYLPQAKSFGGVALLVGPAFIGELQDSIACVEVADAYLAYARLSQWVASEREKRDAPSSPIHTSAVVHPSAVLGQGVRLAAGVVIGPRVKVGDFSVLNEHVVIKADCEIGEHCIIHSGTVIGSDGFGFAPSKSGWIKIEQLGAVRIGPGVEIGANCAVDRGALDDTRIGQGCKLDNLIQVAHNVVLGEHCAIAGCVGIAGSARIGNRVQLGGGAGVLGHLTICDDVIVSAMSLVASSISEPGFYSGVFPLGTHSQWERSAALVRQLPDLRRRLRLAEQTLFRNPS
jgi:UDP-3-O-[3-hydroxymyristoyl] glucosamine N-acyltransferase